MENKDVAGNKEKEKEEEAAATGETRKNAQPEDKKKSHDKKYGPSYRVLASNMAELRINLETHHTLATGESSATKTEAEKEMIKHASEEIAQSLKILEDNVEQFKKKELDDMIRSLNGQQQGANSNQPSPQTPQTPPPPPPPPPAAAAATFNTSNVASSMNEQSSSDQLTDTERALLYNIVECGSIHPYNDENWPTEFSPGAMRRFFRELHVQLLKEEAEKAEKLFKNREFE